MRNDKSQLLADRLVVAAVRLTRWLRASDSVPRLTGPQASAMAVIIHSDGISPSGLAGLEQVARPTITRLVNELAAMGLIVREADPDDRRGVRLRASEEGQALWRAGQMRQVMPLIARLDGLSDAQRTALEAALPVIERLSAQGD